jgi:hypothetical protein
VILHDKDHGVVDTDELSDSQVKDLLAIIKLDLQNINLQLEEAYGQYKAEGIKADPRWLSSAKRARAHKARTITQIQVVLRHRKEQRKEQNKRQNTVPPEITAAKILSKRQRAESLSDAFVQVAKDYLGDKIFQDILDRALLEVEARLGELEQ